VKSHIKYDFREDEAFVIYYREKYYSNATKEQRNEAAFLKM